MNLQMIVRRKKTNHGLLCGTSDGMIIYVDSVNLLIPFESDDKRYKKKSNATMVMMMSHQTITSQQIRELDSFELKELFTGDQRSELALHVPDHADEIHIYVAESVHKECFLLL